MLNFIMYDIKNVIFKKYSINQNNSKKIINIKCHY